MKKQTQITKEISVEDLITIYPFARHYLAQKGIRCVACGEGVWLTLEEAAVVNELRLMAMREENYERHGTVYNFFKDNTDPHLPLLE
jgi:hypothetical protein